jgi:4-amino-4-deoxy-L-arabinose transferase-like glycosyltransferase
MARFAEHGTRPYWLIFMLALLLRAALGVWLPNAIAWEDGFRYVKVADNLLSGRGFGSILDNYLSVPALPVLLAGLIAVVGKNFFLLRMCFALIGATSALLGSVLARRLLGSTAGLLTGLAIAVYPPLVYLGALFEYPQALLILLMCVMFLLWYGYDRRGGLWRMALCGLLLGVGVETVPTVLAYLPLLWFCLLLKLRWRMVVPAAVLTIATSLPIAAWATHNHFAFGEAYLTNKFAGATLWLGNNDNYYRYGKSGVVPSCSAGFEFTEYCQQSSQASLTAFTSGLSDLEAVNTYERISREHAVEFLRESPARTAKLMLRKFGLFWGQFPDAVSANDTNAPAYRAIIMAASYFPALILAIYAVWSLRARFVELLPIYFYIVAMSAPYVLMMPVTRYRLPIDYLLLMFAAYVVARLLNRGSAIAARI